MSDSSLTTFVASDGENLALQDWPLEPGAPVRGWVLLVHGLGEHAGRYDALAQQLNSWGFAVRGYDHYGHGESSGVRGTLPTEQRLVEDLVDMLTSTRQRMPPRAPLIVLGHSLGGLVAADCVARCLADVDGLVLSSPALDGGLNVLQKALLALLYKAAPNFRVPNGLSPRWISHDPQVVQAYRQDALVHPWISVRLGHYIVNAGPRVLAAASQWSLPTLLMYAGDDHLVNPQGSLTFAQAAPGRWVDAKLYPKHYHEIFNERDRAPVYARLKDWLDHHFFMEIQP